MSLRFRTVGGLAACFCFCLLDAAGAQSTKATAEATFQEGKALLERGEIAKACERLSASLELDEALGTRLYLADCYEQDGRLASAWATFREALGVAKARGDSRRAQVAEARAEALEGQLSRLMLKVSKNAERENLRVTVDGVDIPKGSWNMPFPVDPGELVVRAELPGGGTWTKDLVVPEQPKTIVVTIPSLERNSDRPSATPQPPQMSEPVRKPLAPPVYETRSHPGWNRQATIGWVTFGTGLGGLAVGSVLGIRAVEKSQNADELCRMSDSNLCSARGTNMREQAEDLSTYSVVALATGGALTAGGLVLVLTAPQQRTASTGEVRLAARFGKAPAVSLEGTF